MLLATFDKALPDKNPFHTEIISQPHEDNRAASGLPIAAHRTLKKLDHTDIIFIPSMMVADSQWKSGRYPALVRWLSDMHAQGTDEPIDEISWAVGYWIRRLSDVFSSAPQGTIRGPIGVNFGFQIQLTQENRINEKVLCYLEQQFHYR